MPSVGMRRTTRVFGARVLRSGRRLFTTQEEVKHMRRPPLAVADAEEDWIELLDRGGGGDDLEYKENGWCNSNEGAENVSDVGMHIDDGEEQLEMKLGESKEMDLGEHDRDGDDHVKENRRWGKVYSRKRKTSASMDCSSPDKNWGSDRRYGKKFFRKQVRKKIITENNFPSDSEKLPSIEPGVAARAKSRRKKVARVSVAKPPGMNLPNSPATNGVTIHQSIQKRRSSLRSRKHSNPSSFRHPKAGGLVQDGVPFYPIKSSPEISRSIRRANFKELKYTLAELTHSIDSVSCNANILVIESDRCYREGGAVVTMEMAASKQWFLVVKRDGVERFKLEAQTAMRPCFCNRITHAIIWAGGDESWKLEFPNRQDWFVFKELYRKCSERSVQVRAPSSSIIPVPRVNEVPGYVEQEYVPFTMPDSYIRSRGDEVARLSEKSDPIYDMDTDDDEWLKKFNDEHDTRVDEDTFEKVVDAFERGIYGSPEGYSDAASAVDRCQMLASKEVLEALYSYWMAKRKKKHSALVRVFQFYKPKRAEQLNFKGVLRKKRSFRRHGNQAGRGKQLTFLRAALYEKTAAEEERHAAIKVQEAEAAAKRAEQVAIVKRQIAQLLMEVADLSTYKAAMALRIAEARATAGSAGDTDELLFR